MCISTQADTALSRLRHIERQSCEECKQADTELLTYSE